ncbi:HdeD family acid-resistance protein [Qipengyuania zhejiangensis]|uniref:HdeD family acid-resistance protein n=1 Tax=Qipengyuania zhejiangensis TaxID=3077782 RepID=UPI002D771816|nr:DUF308 domain-containing protein [Qipengyuania sp. Z2]
MPDKGKEGTALTQDRNERAWTWVVALGLAMIVVGLLAVLNPVATGIVSGLFLSFIFLLGGGIALLVGFTDNGLSHRLVDIIFGLLSIAAGVLTAINPLIGAVTLAWIAGAMFVVSGVMEVVSAIRGGGHRGLLLFLGIVDVLIGLYFLFSSPELALVLLAILVGAGFAFRGISILMFGWMLRKNPSI